MQHIVVLYSKYSQECRSIMALLEQSTNPALFPICIDNREIRERLRVSKKVQITQVPTILLFSTDGGFEKFEGPGITEWLTKELSLPALPSLPVARPAALYPPAASPQTAPAPTAAQMQQHAAAMQQQAASAPHPIPQPQGQYSTAVRPQPPAGQPVYAPAGQPVYAPAGEPVYAPAAGPQLQPVQQLHAPAAASAAYTSLGTPIGALAKSMVPTPPPNPAAPASFPPQKNVKDIAAEMQAGRNNLDKPTQQLMQQTPLAM